MEEEIYHPLSNIFTQPLEVNATEQTFSFQFRLCDYLNTNDLKSLRKVNAFCHRFVSLSHSFGAKVNCKISEKWHREYTGIGMTYGTAWHYFTLDQFAYHRRHDMFKHYWTSSSKSMVELTLKRCSMECDGLAFILNECRNLETLVIDDVKLKHWGTKNCTDLHRALPVSTNPLLELRTKTVAPETTAMCRSLRTLKLINLRCASNCTLEYLRDRSGNLQNVVLKQIFKNHTHAPSTQEQETIEANDFSAKLALIINANALSLQKLEVTSNEYQADLLQLLSRTLEALNTDILRSLKVTISTEAEKLAVQTLLHLPNVRPELLAVQILERFSSEDVGNVLNAQYDFTRHLKLVFNGYKLAKLTEEEEDLPEVDLQPSLHQFKALESLTIKDIKSIPESGFRMAKGLKGKRKERAPGPDLVAWANTKVKSSLDERFLYRTPFLLKELTLEDVVFANPDVTNLASLRNITGYRCLTKLEIIGPLLHPLTNFRVIPKEMPKLTTLRLVNCGLSDASITGLSRATTNNLRKCGTHLFHNLVTGSGDAFDLLMKNLDRSVRKLTLAANIYPPETVTEEEILAPPRKKRTTREEYRLPENLRNKNFGDDENDDGFRTDDDDEHLDNYDQLAVIVDAEGIEPIQIRGVAIPPPIQVEAEVEEAVEVMLAEIPVIQEEENNQGHQNEPEINQGHQNEPEVNQVHQNEPEVNQGHQNEPEINQGHQNELEVNQGDQNEPEIMEQDANPEGALNINLLLNINVVLNINNEGENMEEEIEDNHDAPNEPRFERELAENMEEEIEDNHDAPNEPRFERELADIPLPIVDDMPQDSRSYIYMLKELEHLDLSKNCEISNITVYDSLKNPSLKILNLEDCTRITDFTLEWIAKYHPNLEVLHVKGCRRLSQFGFNQLIQKCPKLQRIFTTKKMALDEFEHFNVPLSPCYKDITRYPDVTTTRAENRLIVHDNQEEDDD